MSAGHPGRPGLIGADVLFTADVTVSPLVLQTLDLALASTAATASEGGSALPERFLLLAAVLAVATAAGLLLRRRDGRFRSTDGTVRVDLEEIGGASSAHRTFLQVSAATCATCPQVARVLAQVADAADDVSHVEIRVEDHDALTRRLGVLRTPTVLLLDEDGVVLSRTSGPLRPEQARAALVHDDLAAAAGR
jgi:thiol-disulfide isomerase/thioredoxin